MPSFYDGQAPSALNSVTDPCPSRIQVNRWWPARGQYDEGKEAATVDGLKKSSRQVRAAQLHKNPVIGRVAAAAHICSSHQAKVLPGSSHLWQSQSILHIRPGSIQVCNPRIRRGSYPVATHVQGGISHPGVMQPDIGSIPAQPRQAHGCAPLPGRTTPNITPNLRNHHARTSRTCTELPRASQNQHWKPHRTCLG